MRKTAYFLSLIWLFLALFLSIPVQAEEQGENPEIHAEAAFSVDGATQQVLVNKNGDELRPIASMTKLISAYLILEAIHHGELTWEDKVQASEYAARISENTELSNVPLQAGESYTVRELFEALVIYSANSTTIALAEHYAGSEVSFVDLMKEQLEEWGIDEYVLVSSTGLSNDLIPKEHWYPESMEEDENHLSARSIAKVSLHLIQDYPEYIEFSKVPERVFRKGKDEETQMKNFNALLPGRTYERQGVLGLKTGTTKKAGACISLLAEQDGRQVIGVVMNAGDGLENQSQRYEASNQLLDYSFDQFENVEIDAQALGLQMEYPVKYGHQNYVDLESSAPFTMTVKKGKQVSDLLSEPRYNPQLTFQDQAVIAPVSSHTELVSYELKSLEYLEEDQALPEVSLTTVNDIEEISTFMKQIQMIVEKVSTWSYQFMQWMASLYGRW